MLHNSKLVSAVGPDTINMARVKMDPKNTMLKIQNISMGYVCL